MYLCDSKNRMVWIYGDFPLHVSRFVRFPSIMPQGWSRAKSAKGKGITLFTNSSAFPMNSFMSRCTTCVCICLLNCCTQQLNLVSSTEPLDRFCELSYSLQIQFCYLNIPSNLQQFASHNGLSSHSLFSCNFCFLIHYHICLFAVLKSIVFDSTFLSFNGGSRSTNII